jgi:hypothetical protein
MKIVILIAFILAVVHADKIITGKVFRDHLAECGKVLPNVLSRQRELDIGLIFCATKKVGGIDINNALNRDKVIANCKAIISDPVKVEQCKDICNTCMDEGFKVPGSNFIKTITAIQCAVKYDLISLIDKE